MDGLGAERGRGWWINHTWLFCMKLLWFVGDGGHRGITNSHILDGSHLKVFDIS